MAASEKNEKRTIGGPSELHHPYGIAIDREGNLYVSELYNHRISVFRAADGAFIRHFGEREAKKKTLWGQLLSWKEDEKEREKWLNSPRGIALDEQPEPHLYVADSENHRVAVFRASDGAMVRTIGAPGSLAGHLQRPYDVQVDGRSQLYVADNDNKRIAVFSAADGVFLRCFGGDRLWKPMALALDRLNEDSVLVVDNSGQLCIFSNEGKFERHLEYGEGGHFASTGALTIDGSGRLCLSHWYNQDVQVFQMDGTFVRKLEGPFQFPTGLVFDQHGTLYVCDQFHHQIQILQL